MSQTMLERQKDIWGRPPLKAALDGGFASKDNVKKAKKLGVKDICFAKRRGNQGNGHVPESLCAQTSQEFSSRYRVGNILAQTMFWVRSLQLARVALLPELRVGVDRFGQPAYACQDGYCGIARRRNIATAYAWSFPGYVCHHNHKYRRKKLKSIGTANRILYVAGIHRSRRQL